MKTTHLTILHSNDLHARFAEWTRMESIVRRLRAELGSDQVLRLDAGDHGDRAFPVTDATRGRSSVALLAAARVDGFTWGNNESLVWPAVHQSALAHSAPYPALAADLRLADGSPVGGLQDWVITERAGLKIGIFGLSPYFPEFLRPLGLINRDHRTVAEECVAALRQAGCDLVVLLSHMGHPGDREMAAAVPGIDVIVGGHTHTVLEHGEQVGGTVIVQAGSYGRFLGRLDLTIREGRVAAWSASLLPTEGEEPDAETAALVRHWEHESEAALQQVVCHLPTPLAHDPLGESPLAGLVARRLQVKFGADLAIIHGGVLLAGLPAGPVTVGDLLRVCPCMLNPTVAELPGQKLLDLLAIPEVELAQKAGRNGMRGETPIGRIFGVGLEGIQAGRTYRVAMNDYLAFGFAPFEALKGTIAASEIAVEQLLRDTLREALCGMCFAPGEPVRMEVWGLDGKRKKFVNAHLVSASPAEVVLKAGPGFTVWKDNGEVMWESPHKVEYHIWPGLEYNLFLFFLADGTWTGDYYNLGLPPAALPGAMSYIDLDLDVLLPAGEPARLLDEDELEAAPYPPAVKERVRELGAWLLRVAGTAEAPGAGKRS